MAEHGHQGGLRAIWGRLEALFDSLQELGLALGLDKKGHRYREVERRGRALFLC